MGTNYYLHYKICPTCGRYDELHIGKSSVGWCFSLHIYPEKDITTFDDWERVFCGRFWKLGSNVEIWDEYGTFITPDKMIDIITKRGYPTPPEVDWNSENDAIPGPNNLLRHKLGRFCIGHGKGTYDYIIGDFS